MVSFNPYLNYDGKCEEAFNFYKSVFGGEFSMLQRVKDMNSDSNLSEEKGNRILHVSLPVGNVILMGSDATSVKPGNNYSIFLDTESEEEADKLFNGLSEGGTVMLPMEKTFWGSYFGVFTDKFDINWNINFSLNKK